MSKLYKHLLLRKINELYALIRHYALKPKYGGYKGSDAINKIINCEKTVYILEDSLKRAIEAWNKAPRK